MTKRNRATPVSAEELEVLQRTGMFGLAKRRTRAIVRQHVAGDSRISTIATDCYLQGVRDASQSIFDEAERILKVGSD